MNVINIFENQTSKNLIIHSHFNCNKIVNESEITIIIACEIEVTVSLNNFTKTFLRRNPKAPTLQVTRVSLFKNNKCFDPIYCIILHVLI